MTITLHYRGADGRYERRAYKTLDAARRYAHARVGQQPTCRPACGYALAEDGELSADGCTMADLFGAVVAAGPAPEAADISVLVLITVGGSRTAYTHTLMRGLRRHLAAWIDERLIRDHPDGGVVGYDPSYDGHLRILGAITAAAIYGGE